MFTFSISRRYWPIAAAMVLIASLGLASSLGSAEPRTPARAADIDPTAVTYKLPSQITWTGRPGAAETAVVLGDPTKPGLYIELVKWYPHNMSRPHFHPNDRYITVLSGTWWVGTGDVYHPEKTIPMHAGTFVTHFAKQVHYDGAKEDGCIIEIAGEGPAPSIDAEKK